MKVYFNINKKWLQVAITCLMTVSLTSCSLFTQSSVEAKYTTPPDVSTERLTQHVRQLSEAYYPRDYTHPENLNASADYIMQQLEPYTDRLSEQKFTVRDKPYRNIIARFGPTEGELIVVGAHYDSYYKTRGADDNASGVAGLLELARLLKQHPPSSPVELVAYSLEEPPFFSTDEMGSSFHARQLVETERRVKLMMSLEMIGYFSDEPDSQDFPLSMMKSLYSDKGHFITVISNMGNRDITAQVKSLMMGASDLPVYSLNAPSFIPGIDYSDHLHYWKQDYPAVMITDTAFYRNHHYHESNGDTWDQLDYQRMAKVVQGVYATVQNLD
ncbi:MAG: M28 family peptidase [Limnobaculum xujianqingii]